MKIKLNKTTLSLATAMGTLAFAATTANAASIVITNHSFEDGNLTGWTNPGANVTDLTVTLPVDANYAGSTSGDLPSTADGDFAATLTLGGDYGYIRQDTGVTIVAGETYTLTVAVGARTDTGLPVITAPGNILLRLGHGTGGLGYITTYEETQLVGSAEQAAGGLVAGGFFDMTASFTAGAADAGQVLSILIGAAKGASSDAGGTYDFDNVRLTDTAAVPEPSTTALLGLGGLALILRRRK